jgi:hypothetical protein
LLKQVYDVRNLNISVIILSILAIAGFGVLSAIAALLILGWLGFSMSIPILLSNPVCWTILAIFGGAAIPTLWKLYRDRKIVLAVVDLGKRLKDPWELLQRNRASNEDFDRLMQEAVVALLVNPKEFYKSIRNPVEIETIFNKFIGTK